jgi:hypothetical protein
MENIEKEQSEKELMGKQALEAHREIAETSIVENFMEVIKPQNVSDYIGSWSHCHGLCGMIDNNKRE